jgi:glycosyltransferase involved in cell wall biosynthesis
MRTAVESTGVPREKITVCANWALPELQPVEPEKTKALRVRLGIDDKFVAAYSGNLGRVHDLDPLLEIAEKLRSAPDFLLLFIGNGAQRASLEATVASRSLPNVRFIDAQPRATLAEMLSAADVHFVTVKPGAERWVFPSKLYGVVGVERPVIFIGTPDSEIAQMITSNGWGACFSPTQIDSAAAELQLLQRRPERLRRFADATRTHRPDDFTVALNKWTALLDVANAPSSPAR